jgi:hypothetical protein
MRLRPIDGHRGKISRLLTPIRPVDYASRWETAVSGVCFAADRSADIRTLDPNRVTFGFGDTVRYRG